MSDRRGDLARVTLAIIAIVALIGSSLLILSPFLPAVIWATMIVVATWPLMRHVEQWLWNRRSLAVLVMTVAILLIFVVPFWAAVGMIVRNSPRIVGWAESISTMEIPPPPAWLGEIPLLGAPAVSFWQKIVDAGVHELLQMAQPYAGSATRWFLGAIGSLGLVLMQFLLTVIFSAVMYARGEAGAAAVLRFGRRLAGVRGEQTVELAAHAIRGVALGVVVTALVQTAVAAAGMFIANIPFAPILSALVFLLCIAQIGPGLVLVPAVIWMYATSDPLLATVLLVFSVVAMTLDNVLRPILIRKGVDLPFLLILVGVVGGLIAFGLVGIFIGPTVLAVAYTLLGEWIAEAPEPPDSGRSVG
ncbi:MAG TPA: AI-2E family transporter YdiK [Stellaceae bacterium]|nr:AI-2E family transporter YdiK [Stellaceae bacterium]